MSGKQSLAASIIIGGVVNHTLKNAFKVVGNCISETRGKLKGLHSEQKKINSEMEKLREIAKQKLYSLDVLSEISAQQKKLNLLKKELEFKSRLAAYDRLASKYGNKAAAYRSRMMSSIGSLQQFMLPAWSMIKTSGSFESAAMGMAKQLDGARDARGKLTKEFFDMREEIIKKARTTLIATT